MTREHLISLIDAPSPREKILVDNQDTDDIMQGILRKHEQCKQYYDRIAAQFAGGSTRDICRRLYSFLRNNIAYDEETIHLQELSAPQTILQRGHSDCKCYALFIGGVLDALTRRGKTIAWCFRFASYKIMDDSPGHVFIVVDLPDEEVWIDPVLPKFNHHLPFWSAIDEDVTSGSAIGCACETAKIGTTAETGAMIQKLSPALATVPVVGYVAAAVGEVLGFFLKTFGNKYKTSTGVRWSTQQFEYYVLGEKNVTSDNKVNEADTDNMHKWFNIVLGVPVYDQFRYHALRGTAAGSNKNLNQSYLQRAQAYLQYPEVAKAGVSLNDAITAAHIADNMPESGAPGSWAWLTAAPSMIDTSGAVTSTTQTPKVNQSSLPVSSISPLWIAVAAAGLLIILD